MHIQRLALTDFRCHPGLDLQLEDGLNLIVGDNGCGKTTVLEAAYTLSRGQSFRGARATDVIRRGAESALVAAHIRTDTDDALRIAVERDRTGLRARLGTNTAPTARELALALPVQMVDPSLHELVDAGSKARRRFMDWGLFHVEQSFLAHWRHLQRVLRQRNAALRAKQPQQAYAFDEQFVAAAEPVTAMRQRLVETLAQTWSTRVQAALGDDWSTELTLRPGWADQHSTFADALHAARPGDARAGFSTVGPHRADLKMAAIGRAVRHQVSRGQQKLLVLSLHLALADQIKASAGVRSVILIDDLASEMGAAFQEASVAALEASGNQCLITALSEPAWAARCAAVFHVEHGRCVPSGHA